MILPSPLSPFGAANLCMGMSYYDISVWYNGAFEGILDRPIPYLPSVPGHFKLS